MDQKFKAWKPREEVISGREGLVGLIVVEQLPKLKRKSCRNKDQPDEKSKGYIFCVCYIKGVSHHHLHFGTYSKAGVEKIRLEKGRLWVCLIVGCYHREL